MDTKFEWGLKCLVTPTDLLLSHTELLPSYLDIKTSEFPKHDSYVSYDKHVSHRQELNITLNTPTCILLIPVEIIKSPY